MKVTKFNTFTFLLNALSLVDLAFCTEKHIWVQDKLREGFSILFFELPCTSTLISYHPHYRHPHSPPWPFCELIDWLLHVSLFHHLFCFRVVTLTRCSLRLQVAAGEGYMQLVRGQLNSYEVLSDVLFCTIFNLQNSRESCSQYPRRSLY